MITHQMVLEMSIRRTVNQLLAYLETSDDGQKYVSFTETPTWTGKLYVYHCIRSLWIAGESELRNHLLRASH